MKCDVCSAEFAESDLIAIEGRRVCGGCKPLVLQQLREGVLTPMADLLGALRGEGELGFGELLATTWNARSVAWKLTGLVCITLIPVVLVTVAFMFAPESPAISFFSNVLIDLLCAFGTVGTVVLFLNLEAVDRNTSGVTVEPPTN